MRATISPARSLALISLRRKIAEITTTTPANYMAYFPAGIMTFSVCHSRIFLWWDIFRVRGDRACSPRGLGSCPWLSLWCRGPGLGDDPDGVRDGSRGGGGVVDCVVVGSAGGLSGSRLSRPMRDARLQREEAISRALIEEERRHCPGAGAARRGVRGSGHAWCSVVTEGEPDAHGVAGWFGERLSVTVINRGSVHDHQA